MHGETLKFIFNVYFPPYEVLNNTFLNLLGHLVRYIEYN